MSLSYRSTNTTHPPGSVLSSTVTLRLHTGSRPRTAPSNFGLRQQIICAVTESRGVSATVGLCFINTTNGTECILSEIRDSQTYVRTLQKLNVFDPTEILAPVTSLSPRKSTLISLIEQYFSHVPITQLPRKYYNEQQGHDYIQQLCVPADIPSILIATAGKFYCLSSCAAALKHVELTYTRFAVHALRMRYEPSEGSMLIDFSTVHSLELLQNATNPKSRDCLFGFLNETNTSMGVRLLRMNILQPLTEKEVLGLRLDAVEELTRAEEMFFGVREALKGFPDMDRLCTQLITTPVKASLKYSEQSINNVIILKQGAACVQPVFEALGPARSGLLTAIRELCSPAKIAPVIDLINDVINEDVAFSKSPLDLRNQRCYAVKSGVNGLLDVARQTYKEATEDVHTLVEELSKEFSLPLELRFETGRGYYLRLHSSDLEDTVLAPVFINVVTRKRFVEFSTLELMKRNAKINDSLTEVLLMSDKTVQQLVSDVAQEVSGLFKVSEGIAMLDMICSFAHLCTLQDYVRPEFTDTLGIKAGRHPIREKIHREHFVPNDVYATQQSRFQIVTGCNMSGKSTYLRTIALITIMSQIGSFVPANYASIPLRSHLFARISTDDSLTSTISTFSAEMREMAFIISNISPTALVIIDELGRGTSSRDGVAIALAICERLVKEKALVWFATHFVDLAEVLGERPGVASLHMTVHQESLHDNGNHARPLGSNMTMLYKVSDGNVPDRHYGLAIAQFVGLPPRILSRATAISQELVKRKEKMVRESGAWKTARRRALVLRFYEMLQQAREAGEGMDDAALGEWVRRLGREFLAKMAAVEGEGDDDDDGGSFEDMDEDNVDNSDDRGLSAEGRLAEDVLDSGIMIENFEDIDP